MVSAELTSTGLTFWLPTIGSFAMSQVTSAPASALATYATGTTRLRDLVAVSAIDFQRKLPGRASRVGPIRAGRPVVQSPKDCAPQRPLLGRSSSNQSDEGGISADVLRF